VEDVAVMELTIPMEISILESALVYDFIMAKQLSKSVEETWAVFSLIRPPIVQRNGTVANLIFSWAMDIGCLLLLRKLIDTFFCFLRALLLEVLFDCKVLAVKVRLLQFEWLNIFYFSLLLPALLRLTALGSEGASLSEFIARTVLVGAGELVSDELALPSSSISPLQWLTGLHGVEFGKLSLLLLLLFLVPLKLVYFSFVAHAQIIIILNKSQSSQSLSAEVIMERFPSSWSQFSEVLTRDEGRQYNPVLIEGVS
jgi:hypothetical protein